jgi:hypothetical protein
VLQALIFVNLKEALKAIAPSLTGDNDALYRMPGLVSLLAPMMQELEQQFLIRLELHEWLAFYARNKRRGLSPLRR